MGSPGERFGAGLTAASPERQEINAPMLGITTPLNMSVSRYTPENMLAALHTCDLIDVSKGEKGCYILNIDSAQRGVGTATCGPDTLEQYRVRPGLFRFRLLIAGSPDNAG